jgi:hypothetical protein
MFVVVAPVTSGFNRAQTDEHSAYRCGSRAKSSEWQQVMVWTVMLILGLLNGAKTPYLHPTTMPPHVNPWQRVPFNLLLL